MKMLHFFFLLLLLTKVCVKGESDPQLNLGRVPCYHYTIDASNLEVQEPNRIQTDKTQAALFLPTLPVLIPSESL
jgi:hypothetical protein